MDISIIELAFSAPRPFEKKTIPTKTRLNTVPHIWRLTGMEERWS